MTSNEGGSPSRDDRMGGSDAREARRVFERVVHLRQDQREAQIQHDCGGDTDLMRRVRGMIAAAEGETAGVTTPVAAERREHARGADILSEGPGVRIGPYKLLQLIGEGGFGSVFLAEQETPVQRRVALKIIKLGMDTRQVVARFEQERQALAMMEHPNIAKVYDAGATEAGRPYFVMELVRGVPVTEFCDRNQLTPRERLELFVPICHAVEHAHQKGIIHRDIKPSNILVTLQDGAPVPKVIDFGIAKATSSRLTEKTLLTEHRQLIGTPAYMSPEQAEVTGLDIDTRSDIYSLGVLLYELLTGSTPFDTKELVRVGFGEIQRIIREVDPPKPSTRVGALGDTDPNVAAHRRTELRKLGAIIRGDLDWIVMKAMEKSRVRRYQTASGFAADVQRHLAGEPVEAAPPSAAYRIRKMIRRRRGLFAAAVAVALTLLVGVVGTGVGLAQARRALKAERTARDAETAERQRAEATTAFLRDMFASIDPERSGGREVTVKDVLDDAASRVGTSFQQQPEVEASLRHTFGETYNQISRYRESKEQFERELTIARRIYGPDDRRTLAAQFGVGAATLQLGDIADASRLLHETAQSQARLFGSADPDTLQTRALVALAMQLAGDEVEALSAYREMLPDQVGTLGASHKTALETMCSIADVLQGLGRLEEAESAARELIAAATKAQGNDGAQTLVGQSILVSVLNDLGRYAEAEPLGRQVLAAKTRIYGADHNSTIVTANVLATTLENLDKFDEAVELLRAASSSAARSLGSEHGTTLAFLNNLARNEQLRGHLEEAERIFREVLEARIRVSGETATPTLAVMNNLGLLLLAQKKPVDAEVILRKMIAGVESTMPEGHWMRGQARVNLARSLVGQAKYGEAEPLAISGYEQLAKALPAGSDRRKIAATLIAEMYAKWGKPEREALWTSKE